MRHETQEFEAYLLEAGYKKLPWPRHFTSRGGWYQISEVPGQVRQVAYLVFDRKVGGYEICLGALNDDAMYLMGKSLPVLSKYMRGPIPEKDAHILFVWLTFSSSFALKNTDLRIPYYKRPEEWRGDFQEIRDLMIRPLLRIRSLEDLADFYLGNTQGYEWGNQDYFTRVGYVTALMVVLGLGRDEIIDRVTNSITSFFNDYAYRKHPSMRQAGSDLALELVDFMQELMRLKEDGQRHE